MTDDPNTKALLVPLLDGQRNPANVYLIDAVFGAGKTSLAMTLTNWIGPDWVLGLSATKNMAFELQKRGMKNAFTIHSICLTRLLQEIRRTRQRQAESTEDIYREDNKDELVMSILNTMYPPPSFNGTIRGLMGTERLDTMVSTEYVLFMPAAVKIMTHAMCCRFGLDAILSPGINGLPAGPAVTDLGAWRELMVKHAIDTEMIISQIEGSSLAAGRLEALMTKYEARAQGQEVNLHNEIIIDFLDMLPTLFNNLYEYFMTGSIELPEGTRTERVWMLDKYGNVTDVDRRGITYAMMPWLVAKLDVQLIVQLVLLLFIDEAQDLDDLKMHILCMMYRDCRTLSLRLAQRMTQFFIAMNQIQGVYIFMDASATPADNLIQIFNVKPEDVKIMALSHRVPRTHAAKLNKIILEHPDECLDATNNVAHVEVPDTAVDGILTENAIEEEHPLPPTIEMEGKTREETRAHTVGILTRNQKNVDELKAVMMGSGEDVGVRTLGGVETTRRVMLDQLRYFENKNIVTMQSMKTYLHAHSSEKAHKYKRNALETQLDAFAQFRGNDLDMFANIMSSMRAWITAKFAVWPSKQLSTIHAVKGEEFKRVDLHHMNLIPSTRSESRKDEFPALYAAEIHLLLVALSRSYCELNIFETPDERKLRLEQKHMVAVPEGQSSSSQLSDTLEAIATVADNSANEASAERTALNIMGLTESPTTMRDFKEYVSTKRMLLDPNEVEAFMVASNVIKRQLLSFQPSAPTCSICLSELGHNGDVMSLMCAHSFCTPCIMHYVDHCITTHLNPACPNCKRALTPQEVASMQEDSD